MKKVAIMMGSDSDWPVVQGVCAQLKEWGVPYEARIMSAHRTPAQAAEFAGSARKNGFGVIICAAGMAAHLAGAGRTASGGAGRLRRDCGCSGNCPGRSLRSW